MKEILFRAKAINRDPDQEYCTDYKNGDWVYGLVEKLPIIKNGEKVYDTDCAEMRNTCGVGGIEVNENTICEFTGSTDKNGKQIFNGDIVTGNFPYCSKGVIVWDEKRCGFYILPYWEYGVGRAGNDKYYKMNAAKLEVIGNVFDNLELLRSAE